MNKTPTNKEWIIIALSNSSWIWKIQAPDYADTILRLLNWVPVEELNQAHIRVLKTKIDEDDFRGWLTNKYMTDIIQELDKILPEIEAWL